MTYFNPEEHDGLAPLAPDRPPAPPRGRALTEMRHAPFGAFFAHVGVRRRAFRATSLSKGKLVVSDTMFWFRVDESTRSETPTQSGGGVPGPGARGLPSRTRRL